MRLLDNILGKRSKILKDTTHLSLGTIVNFVISLLGSIVLMRLLQPAFFGLWKTMQVVMQYTTHSHLGMLSTVTKEAPYLYTRNDRKPFHQLVQSVFVVVTGIGLVEGAILLCIAWHVRHSPLVAFAMAVLAVLVVLQQIYVNLETYLSVTKQFSLKAKVLVGYSLARVLGMVLAVVILGFEAMLAVAVLVQIVVITLLMRKTSFRIAGFKPKFSELKRLLLVGLPILGIGLMETLVQTTDKLITVSALGLEAMGHYSLVVLTLSMILLLPQTLRQIVSIEVYEAAGHSGDVSSVSHLFHRSLKGIALLMPWFCGAAFLGADLGVRFVLPSYLPGLPALKIMCLGVFFLTLPPVCYSFLVVKRREIFAIMAGVGTAFFNVVVTLIILFWFHGGLSQIAFVHAIGYFFLSILLITRVKCLVEKDQYKKKDLKSIISLWITCFWPWIYTIALSNLVERIGPQLIDEGVSFFDALGVTVVRIIVFSLCWLPIFIMLRRLTTGTTENKSNSNKD